MNPRRVMVLGTASHVGKSLVAAGLCRLAARAGLRVRPFKAQNMSNNAAVTVDGGEIGRAQALQALACGVPAHSDMNPVLLKPMAESRCQIVLRGRPLENCEAARYRERAPEIRGVVEECFDRLAAEADLVVLEGAGSCAELNIDWDIANLPMARYSRAEALLVGDISRGGIFAQIIGTLSLLEESDRRLFRGSIINNFHGDPSLLGGAEGILAARSGVPVLGVVPHLRGLMLDEEDSVALEDPRPTSGAERPDRIVVRVFRFPRIANFTDFDALSREPDVDLRYIDAESDEPFGRPDILILPGTRNTIGDLEALRRAGHADRIRRAAEDGVEVVGICGGLQMLGARIADPGGVEGEAGVAEGLGLLAITTDFAPGKVTRFSRGVHRETGESVEGYEIHSGRSSGAAPVAIAGAGGEPLGYGAGLVWGSYLHGLFDGAGFLGAWLDRARERKGLAPYHGRRAAVSRAGELDRFADHLARHLELPGGLRELFGMGSGRPGRRDDRRDA